MAFLRKIREKLIRRRSKKRGSWTIEDIRFVLTGKRFTHTDTVCHRIVVDFVIGGIEPDGDLRGSYYLLHEGGKYPIDGEDLVNLAAHGFSLLMAGRNFGIASYKVETS